MRYLPLVLANLGRKVAWVTSGGPVELLKALGPLAALGAVLDGLGGQWQTLALKETEFIVAARTVGSHDSRIMFRHLLPNVMGPIIIAATFGIPGAIATEIWDQPGNDDPVYDGPFEPPETVAAGIIVLAALMNALGLGWIHALYGLSRAAR